MKKVDWSKNAVTVLERRYLSRDEDGNLLETPDGMLERVASAVAQADEKWGGDVAASTEAFFDLMADQKFLPNSPTLMNAGKPLGQLSACFVLPVGDSMDEIFDAVKNAALIHKSGGATNRVPSRYPPNTRTAHMMMSETTVQ